MAPPAGSSFADLLRRFRTARALTQEELAERAGVTVKAVGALERGERTRPYPHTVRSLADALDLDDGERASLVASVPRRAGSAADPAGATVPTAPTSALLGREPDLERVLAILRSGTSRLLTITGPGGVGKTRVALEVLAREASRFPGGGVFVDLAAVRDEDLVLPHVAAALGIPETSAMRTAATLVTALSGRPLLLVLDNVEQVLGAATAVSDLVGRCPDLVVLVTSRAPLRVRNEHEVVLGPLPVPAGDTVEIVRSSPAARLFLDRTAAAGVPIDLTEGTAATVAAICRRLDGLPLAVELAAAGARLLTPAALLAHLDRSDFPSGPRDLDARQRTMTSTLDWSMELLEPEQESFFCRLAVFSGGFTLAAVAAVAVDDEEDVLPLLSAVVEHSLVARAPSPDGQPRFRILEPIRQYAARRLASSAGARDVADRHARYFHRRVRDAGPALHGPGLGAELDRLEADHANLRAAFLRLVETGRVADAAELAGGLWIYLAVRGRAREGLTWLERLDPGASDAARCRALTGRMGLLFATGDLALMREDAARAATLAARLEDRELAAEALILAGHAATSAADVPSARGRLDAALTLSERAGWNWGIAHARLAQAELQLTAGDLAAAERDTAAALDLARALGDPLTLTFALNLRATLTALQGDHRTTAVLLGESVEVAVAARVSWTLGYALSALAAAAVRLGRAETAARLFGASASLLVAQSLDLHWTVTRELADSTLHVARDQLGEPAFREAWDAGRAATPAEVAELARALTRLARG